ncbi:MAG: exodeoxyribonuclease VII large subunit [Deltaproteobacteria bacterium]|uniref:exodeoxyribonuclease VII large subunit n=1 Tax=Hydrosulfovibrio ferrireducens TaxID=2934181 RepID=UPI00121D7CE1|nr:MAG: exodeoxyribonuclease VII large subunit [Deltaproteobacteria bacterium]
MHSIAKDHVQTVSELTQSIRGVLEVSFPFVTVAGEISNLRCPHSGHLYFTLKDETAQIKAVLFKPQQRYLPCTPADGMQVICRGRISLYEARGEYQLIVDVLAAQGAGALQLAFDLLKSKLAAEGLFAGERKKPLPLLPEKIALITSPSGAAVHDFLSMAQKRCAAVPVEIIPVRVQGAGAMEDIVEAIALCNERAENDVIVLCRGGGSLEDLWTFNEERIARAIAGSRIPVVSAIGHEVDFTIADLVADLRAPTPTGAAEMVVPSRIQLSAQLHNLTRRLTKTATDRLAFFRSVIEAHRKILGDPTSLLDQFRLTTDHALASLQFAFSSAIHQRQLALARLSQILASHSPQQRLEYQQQWVHELRRRLILAMLRQHERKRAALGKNAGLLHAISPLAVLGRGYSIVRQKNGVVVRSSTEVQSRERISVTLGHGGIDCEVKKIWPG